MKLVSVIIPVYNVYDYLDKCLNSIINQTYKSLEIIIVNDGSTDNSKDIIEKYSKIDKRITVINTKNNGLSVARNKGIDASHGDYLSFVDSDDYVDNDFIEYLVKLLEEYNSDISVCSFYQNDSNNKKEEIIVYNKIEAMKECIAYNNMYSSAWNKLYKKEILLQSIILFLYILVHTEFINSLLSKGYR